MTEAEWLESECAWGVDLAGLPGLSYRRFDWFLTSAMPLFFGGGLCAPCQNVLNQLAASADGSEPRSPCRRRRGVGAQAPPQCQAHGMIPSVLLYADGYLTIRECWNRIIEKRRFHGIFERKPPPQEERAAVMAILRDIFGNPFRPARLDPAWLTGIVVKLAHASHGERQLPGWHLDPVRLAVLSDALEEAGCDQEDILGHLRSPGPHVRGCWPVDLILGLS